MACKVALLGLALGVRANSSPVSAVEGLVSRVASSRSDSFLLELIPKDDQGREVMGLSSRNGKVVVQGSSGVSLASGFNWYLNDFLNTTYDWSTYEAIFPSVLPLPPSQSLSRLVKFSYYMNVCTYGYSLAFVDWPYWQKHIDWMAMQGVNLPLAFLGQEKVLLNTFARFNMTFEDMQHFISGPAFLPWFRMGNLQAWGGPITQHWIDSRVELQKQVLERMRSFGMTPALPAFSGFLPPAFSTKHPDANVTRAADWCSFPDPYGGVHLLEPTDAMFRAIGTAFIEEQKALYGTDHIYQCDTYNEMQPRSTDHNYLAASSKSVLDAMQGGDPDAVWLMQGWLFYSTPSGFWSLDRIHAYLSAVPDDRMWILDLAAAANPIWKKTQSFFGKKFIWNTLHDYGGQQGLTGNLPNIDNGFGDAMTNSGSLEGVGLTPEGIWTNYLVYDYTLSKAWGRTKNPKLWARTFGDRRYGHKASGAAGAVWSSLYDIAYASGGQPRSGIITTRPKLGSSDRHSSLIELASKLSPATKAQLLADEANCTWTDVNKDTFLAGYAAGFNPQSPPYHNSLAAAKAWCESNPGCGGITYNGFYQARAGTYPTTSASGESSWLIRCPDGRGISAIWSSLLALSTKVGEVKAYRFDLIDVGREVLTRVFQEHYGAFEVHVFNKNESAASTEARKLLEIIDDFDRLLSTDSNFMLGQWLKWAQSWGSSAQEKKWLDFNARNQLTLWGPTGQINDYATKAWGGLTRAYFKPRWAMLLDQVLAALKTGQTFDQTAYNNKVLHEVEIPWQNGTDTFPSDPEEDAIHISELLHAKYVSGEGLRRESLHTSILV